MTATNPIASDWSVPTRPAAAWYWARVWVNMFVRACRDALGQRIERHRPSVRLADAPLLAEHRSPLWHDAGPDEFTLVAGKVHNLRLARPAFDTVFVPAGAVLSFWRQSGRPSRWRGFVAGREVRAGCVVPTVAGGICQLSNALATCATRSGITLLERHGHTARAAETPDVAAHGFVDATVLWNYVDLRLVAPFDIRIEVDLTADELIVRIRGLAPSPATAKAAARTVSVMPIARSAWPENGAARPVARGCLTCNEASCFRHRGRASPTRTGTVAILVNGWSPEFANYLRQGAGDADWYVPWVRPSRRAGGAWQDFSPPAFTVALLASLWRTLLLRRSAAEGGRRQAALMLGDRGIAKTFAARLKPHHTHLIVDQSLLVPLMEQGALGGRTYDVLVHALPAMEIQRRLNQAWQRWPSAQSLGDFRVGGRHCDAELQALRGARRLITPHVEAARHLRSTMVAPVELIEWCRPPRRSVDTSNARGTRPMVAFPASALPRKGVLELAQAMRELDWRLLVLGTPSSDPQLWHGIDVEHANYHDHRWLSRADVVALPAHIEHSPRALLSAIEHGIPVVATPACGLPARLCTEVPAGDVPALLQGLRRAIQAAGAGQAIS